MESPQAARKKKNVRKKVRGNDFLLSLELCGAGGGADAEEGKT